MLILESRERGASRLVLVFGAGLIGGRVAVALRSQGWSSTHHPLSWSDAAKQQDQLVRLHGQLQRLRPGVVHVVWSAGIGGFSSSDHDLEQELHSFERLLDACESLAKIAGLRLSFHLMSSLGGLFEGQRHIDDTCEPAPKRPYGRLKLAQEKALWEHPLDAHRSIYRLSSVFGPGSKGARLGLIPTLLHDAHAGATTTILGHLTTLRDYLFSEDIARYLIRLFHTDSEEDSVCILASGKPTSIHEVLHRVERICGRQPLVQFAAERVNPTDITVDPAVLPPLWTATDLDTAIHRVHRYLSQA